ncbi:hypothetical protein D3C87_1840740 [compost metagenome]
MPVAEQVQRKTVAAHEDIVARIGAVQADENGRRTVGNRAGSRDRDAAALAAIGSGDELHVAGQAAHRVAITYRVQSGSLQHISLRAMSGTYSRCWEI